MYKILVAMLIATLLSLGLAYPELLLQKDNLDSTIIMDDEILPATVDTGKNLPKYDVPSPDGDPLPPPPPPDPDEDKERLADLGGPGW